MFRFSATSGQRDVVQSISMLSFGSFIMERTNRRATSPLLYLHFSRIKKKKKITIAKYLAHDFFVNIFLSNATTTNGATIVTHLQLYFFLPFFCVCLSCCVFISMRHCCCRFFFFSSLLARPSPWCLCLYFRVRNGSQCHFNLHRILRMKTTLNAFSLHIGIVLYIP